MSRRFFDKLILPNRIGPSDFEKERVLVLGIGSIAADISTDLIEHTKKVYLSYRGGAKLISGSTINYNLLNYP